MTEEGISIKLLNWRGSARANLKWLEENMTGVKDVDKGKMIYLHNMIGRCLRFNMEHVYTFVFVDEVECMMDTLPEAGNLDYIVVRPARRWESFTCFKCRSILPWSEDHSVKKVGDKVFSVCRLCL